MDRKRRFTATNATRTTASLRIALIDAVMALPAPEGTRGPVSPSRRRRLAKRLRERRHDLGPGRVDRRVVLSIVGGVRFEDDPDGIPELVGQIAEVPALDGVEPVRRHHAHLREDPVEAPASPPRPELHVIGEAPRREEGISLPAIDAREGEANEVIHARVVGVGAALLELDGGGVPAREDLAYIRADDRGIGPRGKGERGDAEALLAYLAGANLRPRPVARVLKGGQLRIALEEDPLREVLGNRLDDRGVAHAIALRPQRAHGGDGHPREAEIPIELPPRGGAHWHVVLAPLAPEDDPGQPVLISDGQGGRRVDEAIRQLVQGRS